MCRLPMYGLMFASVDRVAVTNIKIEIATLVD